MINRGKRVDTHNQGGVPAVPHLVMLTPCRFTVLQENGAQANVQTDHSELSDLMGDERNDQWLKKSKPTPDSDHSLG